MIEKKDISFSFFFALVGRIGHFIGDFELILDLLVRWTDDIIIFEFDDFFVDFFHGDDKIEDTKSNTDIDGDAPIDRK